MSTDALQQFQYGAGLAGVEADAAATALGFLNKSMGEAVAGGAEQAQTFAALGVALKDASGQVRDIGDVIPEIADGLGKLGSQQERTAYVMKLFGKQGAALLPFLKDGAKGIETLNKEFQALGGGMKKDFLEQADQTGDELFRLKFAFTGLKSAISLAVLPVVREITQAFQKAVVEFNLLTKETNIAQYALGAFGIVAGAAGVKAAAGWGKFMGVLPKDGSLWTHLFKLGPVLLFIAGIAVLALAFEDLWTWVHGGDSLIGEVIEKFLGLGESEKLVRQLGDAWSFISGIFGEDLGPALGFVMKLLGDAASGVLPRMVAFFVDVVRLISAAVVAVSTLVKAFLMIPTALAEGNLDGFRKLFSASGKTLGSLLGESAAGNLTLKNKAKEEAEEKFGVERTEKAYVPRFEPYTPEPVLPGAPGAKNVENNVELNRTNHINVTVQGARTNEETGRRLGSAIKGVVTEDDLRAAYAALHTHAGENEK